MRLLDHQRLVIAYHGCDVSVRDRVIQHGKTLKVSQNDYDWLGHGVYFWKYGPERAFEWAEQLRKRGKITKPAVLGALVNLGQCFDLFDAKYTDVFGGSYPDFLDFLKSVGQAIPRNEALNP